MKVNLGTFDVPKTKLVREWRDELRAVVEAAIAGAPEAPAPEEYDTPHGKRTEEGRKLALVQRAVFVALPALRLIHHQMAPLDDEDPGGDYDAVGRRLDALDSVAGICGVAPKDGAR